MRLVSFNILEGFRPFAAFSAERRLMDRDRAEAARAVVAELSPDILVLNEALFCRQHAGREVDYAAGSIKPAARSVQCGRHSVDQWPQLNL
jgi:hypothetical protein